jgi:hypothetical protein
MSYDPQQLADQARAAQRTNIPGILLVIMGILNGLGAGYFAFSSVLAIANPMQQAAETNRAYEQLFGKEGMEEMGLTQTPESIRIGGIAMMVVALLGLIGAVISILGGIKMRTLERHALALTGAVACMLPCISCPGCCGPGYLVGIWALIVLLDANVKAAFH